MSEKANRVGPPETGRYIEPKAPVVVGRGAFQEELVHARVALSNQLRAELERFWPGPLGLFSRKFLRS